MSADLQPGTGEKLCPFCAEVIRARAIKCRWCGSDLSEAAPVAPLTVVGEPASLPDGVPEPEPAAETADPEPAETEPAETADPGDPPAGVRRWQAGALVLVVVALLLGGAIARVIHLGGADERAVARIVGLAPTGDGSERGDVARQEIAGAVVASPRAKEAGLVAATAAVEKVLSYHATSLDADVAAAREVLTGDMRGQYDDTMAAIRERTLAQRSSVEAVVVAASAIVATDDDVKALLFVNQTTEGKKLDRPRVDLNRVVVTLHRGAGDWRITHLSAL